MTPDPMSVLDEVQYDEHDFCIGCKQPEDRNCAANCIFVLTRAKYAPPDPTLPEWVTALGLEWDGRPNWMYPEGVMLWTGNSIRTDGYTEGYPLRPRASQPAVPELPQAEAKPCECATWGDSRPLWIKHHRNCKKYDPATDGTVLIKRLVRGMEEWASDEDGIHPQAWSAYQDAKLSIGEPVKDAAGLGYGKERV